MRILTILLVGLLSFTAAAQRTITKETGDFHEIKVFDLMEVNLILSDENKVVITGMHTEDVKVINSNGTLKLRMELETRFRGEDTFIEVYFTDIDVIDANEGSSIVVNEMIEQPKITLKSQEGGRIRAGLQVDHAEIRANSGGVVRATGLAKTQEIKLSTGGIYEGRDLETLDTEIGITAAGEAEVNASDRVKVRVTAGGNVDIYGNPTTIDKKRVAGGKVRLMDQ